VKGLHAEEWEDLARREPYFAVLTREGLPEVGGNNLATEAFFETGEEDLSSLLAAIASLLGRSVSLGSSLDFGCGAGRLTLALARRATSVVACDVAPTMLAHARRNAQRAGLGNITFIQGDELAGLRDGQFDFICSLLVLQYIPPRVGYAIIRGLLRLLAPAGIAALQVTFERPGAALRRLARAIPRRSRVEPRAIEGPGDRPGPSYLQMNEYDDRAVHREIEAAGAREIGRFPTRHGEATGAVLIIQKPRGPV
jgi:SAM-dependent methyltransferase